MGRVPFPAGGLQLWGESHSRQVICNHGACPIPSRSSATVGRVPFPAGYLQPWGESHSQQVVCKVCEPGARTGERHVSMMCGARSGRVEPDRAECVSCEPGRVPRQEHKPDRAEAERHLSTMCGARPGRVRELRARTGTEAGAQARAGEAERHVDVQMECVCNGTRVQRGQHFLANGLSGVLVVEADQTPAKANRVAPAGWGVHLR